jgi:hypothetical protein
LMIDGFCTLPGLLLPGAICWVPIFCWLPTAVGLKGALPLVPFTDALAAGLVPV